MLNGGQRLIGCPYKKNGIVVNSKGEISYCAPKSPIIGSGVLYSSEKLYKKNKSKLNHIKKNHCKSCIHDYHYSKTLKEYLIYYKKPFWIRFINIYHTKRIIYISKLVKKKRNLDNNIFIVGWYGTETVGDKAILGGIIDYYSKIFKDKVSFSLSSLYPIITERTIRELSISKSISLVPVYDKEFIRHSISSKMVIMGGGPLMDLEELALPLISFKLATKNKIQTVIHGCGIGPLTKKRFINATKLILELADEIKLRDTNSKEYAINVLKIAKPISVINDPAKDYIIRRKSNIIIKKEDKHIACFLRDWTYEYYNKLDLKEFEILKSKFEKGLARTIYKACEDIGINRIKFYHMHNFVIGNDDRDFSIEFVNKFFKSGFDVYIDNNLSTVEKIITAMSVSTLNICMRFHSVLFAHTLDTNFLAIDYTNGGKIYSYLNTHQKLRNLLSIDELTKI